MNKRFEKYADIGLVCLDLSVAEMASVVDQSIEKCLRCPVLDNCDPKTQLTVERLIHLEEEDQHYPTLNKSYVLIVGKKTADLEVCGVASASFKTNKKVDLLNLTIPQRFIDGR